MKFCLKRKRLLRSDGREMWTCLVGEPEYVSSIISRLLVCSNRALRLYLRTRRYSQH
jgi:hypothetical protein